MRCALTIDELLTVFVEQRLENCHDAELSKVA